MSISRVNSLGREIQPCPCMEMVIVLLMIAICLLENFSHQLPHFLPWHTGDDDQSLVTLVVAPVSPMFAAVQQLTTSRIAGLQDFLAHYRADPPLVTSVSKIQSPEADLMTLSGWLIIIILII